MKANLSDTALVRRYEALDQRSSKMVDRLINAGLGDLTISMMRQQCPNHPIVSKYLALIDESVDLRREAERRYGPGMITVRQLIWK